MVFWVDEDLTYRSGGKIHQNRIGKTEVETVAPEVDVAGDIEEPVDNTVVADSALPDTSDSGAISKEAAPSAAASRSISDAVIQSRQSGHLSAAAATNRIEPGGYQLPSPGKGTQASFGKEGTTSQPASDGGGGGMGGMMGGMGGMMGGMGGGEGGGGGASAGGGGGGGGMPSGMASMIGRDTAAIDDEKDRADEELFQDDTDVMAHQASAAAASQMSTGRAAELLRKKTV